jgi:hypothetical protein
MDNLEREALERKKKMIALGCLPLSVGFFVWRLQGSSNAAPPPPPPPPSVTAKAAPTVAAAAGPVLKLEKGKIVAVPTGGRDPFKPAFATTPPKNAGTARKPVTAAPAFEPPTRIATLPPLPDAGLRPFGAPPAPAVGAPPSVVPAPAAPVVPYMLTGIVKGFPDIAILRHADGSRRIARVGDLLDQKYRLAAIDVTSVRIEGAGIKKTLELGEAGFTLAPQDNAAAPTGGSLPGALNPKTETTLGENNDTNNS